ncbi:MAG: uncharacterized protein JWO82_245, partial [Akkermansiaceae bacterium]|nr:uncharacterized protein [Akkermansiaceae bacterium]
IQSLSESEPAQELSIGKGTLNTWNLTWQGAAGRTDFVQWSLDLATWTYAPFIENGDGARSYGVSSTAPRMFFRLVHSDQVVTTDPKNDDFDGDHVSNWTEVLQGTDPLGNADDDLDSMPSDWELRFLLDPHDPLDAATDRDGDGISNLAEFTAGTDPTDYYNGEQPHFTLISGDQQYAEPDTFSTAPLVTELRVNGIPLPNAPVRIEAYPSTPALISLSSDGSDLATRIDTTSGPDGRVAIFVKHGPVATSNYFDFSAGSEVTSRAFSIYTTSAITQVRLIYPPGTLGRDAADAIDSRLAGRDPLAAKPVFSLQDHAAATYVRNPGCWAYDLRQQMTCISPWNSMDGVLRAGVAITPRHVLNAAHFFLNPGTIIRFITADNAVIERTIVSRVIHPDYQPEPPYPDLAVYTLDSDLPPEITPCKMLPSDFAAALGPLTPYRPPALGLDQEEKALVFDFGNINTTGGRSFATFYPPTLPAARSSYHEGVVTGDSGNPAFLILHDSLALLTVWSTGSLGTFTTTHLAALNAMISAADAQAGVNTGFQIQTVDLSGYLPFSP